MLKVPPFFRRGMLLSSLGLLAACSGTQADSDATAAPDSVSGAPIAAGDTTPVATPAAESAGHAQDPSQDVAAQRRAAQIARSLDNARKALQLNLWKDALAEGVLVLELDPHNVEAQRIVVLAQEKLGDAAPRSVQDEITRASIGIARDRFRARQEAELAEALEREGRYGDALEHYERAVLVLRHNPLIPPSDPLVVEMQTRRDRAMQLQAAAMQDAQTAQIAASRAQLEDRERQRMAGREARIQRLLEQANADFQLGNFGSTLKLLDQVLALDPTHNHARDLRELADRANHENRLEVLRQRWKAEWSATFDDLNTSNVPQSDILKFDVAHWEEIAGVKPLQFAPPEDVESPEERAIVQKLKETRTEHRFASATVTDWSKYYQGITGVNFIIASGVDASAELTDFTLPTMSVHDALSIIGDQTGLKWHVKNGVVELVTSETAIGKTYLVPYGVQELVLGIANKPGPDLKLRVPGEEDFGAFDDEDPLPSVVEEGRLQDLIRANIEPESWDVVGTMSYANGVLLVRHTREVQQAVEKLLNDLRQAIGVQVDVEARFLKVEDSFLEDIGVDFRGLGNQAAEGLPGRGLEQNNRSNLRFDDFGRPEQVNPASPSFTGTGTEPGFFYDDGGDGDLVGRTEHLYDRTLGAGDDGLTNAGGLAMQWAWLDDTELEMVLRAVAKQERSEEIVAPRLLVYNNTRASMQALRHTSYIKDFDVEIAQAAAVANPVVDVVRDGVVLDVRPVVSADRRYITMELRPTVMTLQLPIPTFTTTLGAGQPVSIQLPNVQLQRVRTTVTMPDGGTVMLGGMKLAERQEQISGVPILKDLPVLSFLFSRKGTYVRNRKVLILIRASIILSEEHEPLIRSDPFDNLLTSTR